MGEARGTTEGMETMTQDAYAGNTGYSGYMIQGETMPEHPDQNSKLRYAAFAAEHHVAQAFLERLQAHEAIRPPAGTPHHLVQDWIDAHPGGLGFSRCNVFSMMVVPWITAQGLGLTP